MGEGVKTRILISITLCLLGFTAAATAQTQNDVPFARPGAFASYSAFGGFVAYFEGVSGNASYTVGSVFQNGTMKITIIEHINGGTDLSFLRVINVTDNYFRPTVFPAVPPIEMKSGAVAVFGITCMFVKSTEVNVPAGTFRTQEFLGRDSNGTGVFVWLDNNTGLVVEMARGGSVLQLSSTNIASPISTPSQFVSSFPYTAAIAVSLIIGISAFLLFHRQAQRKR